MYLAIVYVHVITAVLFTGYALFWAVMAFFLRRSAGVEQRATYLDMVSRASFPPASLPKLLTVRLSGLGWPLLFVLIATGLILLTHGRQGTLSVADAFNGRDTWLSAKLLLVAAALAGQWLLATRRSVRAMFALFAMAPAIDVLSSLMIR